MKSVFEILKELIDIPSPTGDEGPVADFLEIVLKGAGFHVHRQIVEGRRANLYAYAEEPTIVLSTHMDTVTPFIPFSEDDEAIYGRGACDAKGCLAVQTAAAAACLKKGIRNAGLLFVVGEEYGSDGAKAANTIPNKSKVLVNGEPTENRLALGSKGALRFRLTAAGRSAHAAYPEEGESAILMLLEVLNDLMRMDKPETSPLGKTTMNIGKISGGTHANVVADSASAEIMYRLPVSASILKTEIETVIQGRVNMDILFECEPVIMSALTGFESTVVSYTTDIPLLTNWGEPFLIGPGSIRDAHSEYEHVKKADLLESVNQYTALIERFAQ